MLEPTPKMHLIGIRKTFLIYKRGQPDNFVLAYKRDQPDTKAFGHIDATSLICFSAYKRGQPGTIVFAIKTRPP